ncbi:CpaF family protein [Aquibacillus halophilus]|uniref:CpaF family protein n=1 Tax=Aquibacillus halophilus TaxID=930132 RepID=A0A6A8DF23_9BACI|nr:CpaF family protein [Aquibacillus halophilus]MRH44305.1 CpaF family protein [Aquibacillus halophilus]
MSLFNRTTNKTITEQKIEAPNKPKPIPIKHETITVKAPKMKSFWELESKMHAHLVEELKKKPVTDQKQEKLKIKQLGEDFLEQEGSRLTFEEKKQLIDTVQHELLAYGPITPLLENPNITEVMVNGPTDVFYEQEGKILRSVVSFRDDQHISNVIERIVAPIGRRVDESSPMVDARLPDGSRVNAIIPPLAIKGPTLTIRKFSAEAFTMDDLVNFNTLSKQMAEFLDMSVKSRLNIFISGGTGSGKTSTLNVLSSRIPDGERIVTIEDAAELKLTQEHIVSLESRPPNIEGKGQITIRDLVRNSLRMRPDRIIVGEIRDKEALDMLQAMNTGHDGSLSTGHANSPRDMIARIETMVMMAGFDLPIRAIREQISNAIDLIVQQSRMKDGTRKITQITEVLGMEGDTIVLQDVFKFIESGRMDDGKIIGEFVSTGIRPKATELFELNGYHASPQMFSEEW